MNIIPNYICQGMGEKSLEEKIAPWIDTARSWFDRYFISPDLPVENPTDRFSLIRDRIINIRALWEAAPALDVTMHPNGLAVVSTDSLAPASAERAMQFRLSLMRVLLDSAEEMRQLLYLIPGWSDSEQARSLWLATTMRTINGACSIAGLPYDWDSFLEAQLQIRQVEDRFENEVFSAPMLKLLRDSLPLGRCTKFKPLTDAVCAIVKNSFDTARSPFERREIERIYRDRYVLFCKNNPDICAPWHRSPTARLYEVERFKNKKDSTGYFF